MWKITETHKGIAEVVKSAAILIGDVCAGGREKSFRTNQLGQ